MVMRRENNRWLGWKRITQNKEDKIAAGAFGRARNYGKTASVSGIFGSILWRILVVNV